MEAAAASLVAGEPSATRVLFHLGRGLSPLRHTRILAAKYQLLVWQSRACSLLKLAWNKVLVRFAISEERRG